MGLFDTDSQAFKNRREAGKQLALALEDVIEEDALILGLPRGGVPVAYEVAERFGLPLSVLVSRKIGAPQNPEFGVGAIAEGGAQVMDSQVMRALHLSEEDLKGAIKEEQMELKRRVERYRNGNSLPNLEGRQVVLIDDGLATGVTALAAIRGAKNLGAKEVVFASPVCAASSIGEVRDEVDRTICVLVPENLRAIGMYYRQFGQTSDREVEQLLEARYE